MEMSWNQVESDSKPLATFITVDSKCFKEVVQRLTGLASETATNPVTDHLSAPVKGNFSAKKPAFKLHERRQYKSKLEIIKPAPSFKQGAQCWQQQRLSHSASRDGVAHSRPVAVTPTKGFSSLSLGERSALTLELNTEEEERAIRERRFYLHPSPRSKPGFNEPELLSLFPLTSPDQVSANDTGRHRQFSPVGNH